MYTKGEWKPAYHGNVNGYEKYSVCTDTDVVCNIHVKADGNEANANAHLIASAPDMYEALKVLVKEYNVDLEYCKFTDIPHWEKACKALAKAEGK